MASQAMPGSPSIPDCGCALGEGIAGEAEGVGGAAVTVAAGDAVVVGTGATVKSVNKFAVVCDATTVPSRQTCDPTVAPGAITCRNGVGFPDEVAYVVGPMTSSPDRTASAGRYETKVPHW